MHSKQEKFNKLIIKWIVKNSRPINVVTDKTLLEAIEVLDPRASLPSEYFVGKEILLGLNFAEKTTS